MLADFTLDAARAFTLYEQERPEKKYHHKELGVVEVGACLSSITVRKKLRMLKVFASWLEKEAWTPNNVLRLLELPKAEHKEIQPLSRGEEIPLAKSCDDRTGAGARRLALVLIYLSSTLSIGARVR
ncbi:MAG: hypothetical protein HY689_12165 [Chloroflexi bacterium]|nr:hypothetical protein [Chloroflexota bacterium]